MATVTVTATATLTATTTIVAAGAEQSIQPMMSFGEFFHKLPYIITSTVKGFAFAVITLLGLLATGAAAFGGLIGLVYLVAYLIRVDWAGVCQGTFGVLSLVWGRVVTVRRRGVSTNGRAEVGVEARALMGDETGIEMDDG